MRECSRHTTLTYNYLMSIVIVVVARASQFSSRRAIEQCCFNEHCNTAGIISRLSHKMMKFADIIKSIEELSKMQKFTEVQIQV